MVYMLDNGMLFDHYVVNFALAQFRLIILVAPYQYELLGNKHIFAI